jgi:aryl-alcohol dehydrogenase-like predicted oxidoreductase
MVMKLALGTVQFGVKYGVSNRAGQVPIDEVSAIVNSAASSGIDTLDTAIGYGISEQVLGQVGVQDWRVISKLPPLPDTKCDVAQWVHEQIAGSLNRLNLTSLDAILLHHPADLLGATGQEYRAALAAIKDKGLVHSVGISIYSPVELDQLFPVWRPDLVQAPCNVLDRRLVTSGWLSRLHDNGIRVHLRSAFLQGLLLMDSEQRPAWFLRWSDLLTRWRGWCDQQGLSVLEGSLSYVTTLPGVERVIVGVDSTQQLHEIVQASQVVMPPVPDDLLSDDLELIEPSRWNLS